MRLVDITRQVVNLLDRMEQTPQNVALAIDSLSYLYINIKDGNAFFTLSVIS